jgi:hypothetical protein
MGLDHIEIRLFHGLQDCFYLEYNSIHQNFGKYNQFYDISLGVNPSGKLLLTTLVVESTPDWIVLTESGVFTRV